MCKKNTKFITEVLKIWLLLSLSTMTVLAQNTNTSSSYPFHVCHAFIGDGNVNCTGGGVNSYSGNDVGYYNFSIVNTSAYNVSLPEWTIYSTDDSFISSYGYEYCPPVTGYCRNSSQWDDNYLALGVFGKYYNNWIWTKFPRNESTTGINYCDNAYMCLFKYSSTYIAATGEDFHLYYSHNQTWQERNLTWDDHPEWADSFVDKANITSTDDVWICWDVSDAYCDNINDNATYMIRNIISEFTEGTRHLNFTVGALGVGSYDTYVNESNPSGTYGGADDCYMRNLTGSNLNAHLEVRPNYIDFPGSRVDNASLMVYVPANCNNASVFVEVYECGHQYSSNTMNWTHKPNCTLISGTATDWSSTGWKTIDIKAAVQRAALSGAYLTSNITLMLTTNTTSGVDNKTCFESQSGGNDPRVEIGYTYTTKNKLASFYSSNYTTFAPGEGPPKIIANITWALNASSQLNMTNETNNVVWNYRPNGQTDDQWIFMVCSDSETEGPEDIYLNLTSITNSTGDSLTSLPSCVQSFYHYSNSTNVHEASEANITGNTARRVLYNLQNGTCGYIWQNITLNNCTAGDYFEFDWTWTAKTDS